MSDEYPCFETILETHTGFAMRQAQRFYGSDVGHSQQEDLRQAAIEGLLIAAAEADWRHIERQSNPTAYFLSIAKREISALLIEQAAQFKPTSLGCGCGAHVCGRCKAKAIADAERRLAMRRIPASSKRSPLLSKQQDEISLHAADGSLQVEPSVTDGLGAGVQAENELIEELHELIDLVAGQLGDDVRQIMRLAYIDGLDDAAIAEATGIPKRSVNRYRNDATDRVRALYMDHQKI